MRLNQPAPPLERRGVVQRQQLKRLENCAHRDDGRPVMALVRCPDCSNAVSETAYKCPKCGCRVIPWSEDSKAFWNKVFKGIFFIVIAVLLLAKTIDFAKTYFKQVDIHDAASEGNIEAVKQHLADGADVDARDHWGKTPLHVAVGSRRFDRKVTVELLIAAGADVNAKNDGGFTPLHIAAIQGHKEIVKLLITKGANVNAQKNNGWTPLDQAIDANKKEITELIHKHGGKTRDWLEAAGN